MLAVGTTVQKLICDKLHIFSKMKERQLVKNYLNAVCVMRKSDYWNKKEKMLQKAKAQMEMNNERNYTATYLATYMAFMDEDFRELFRSTAKPEDEFGVWLEIEKPLAEKVGIPWRGKLGMDWVHTSSVAYLMGYNKEEKELLIDEVMSSFKEVFGHYPKTIAVWVIDIHSVKYLTDKYGIDAVVICREQWGMDGMSPWGGPYQGGYFPCKNNIICPAQTIEEQVNTPVFRMYINDPIYSYYEHEDEEFNGIPSAPHTQEPTWELTGQNPKWFKWILDYVFGKKAYGFRYIQLGHENSFGWDRVKKGRDIQHNVIDEYGQEKYNFECITIGEMGRRFKAEYKTTPIRTAGVLDDWAEQGRQSVWFNNENYRVNVFTEDDTVWIRDIHAFDQSYTERYLQEPNEGHGNIYDNLPIMDGVRFAAGDIKKPGFYFGKGTIKDFEQKENECLIQIDKEGQIINLLFSHKKIEISSEKEFEIDFRCSASVYASPHFIVSISEKQINYTSRRKNYFIDIEDGIINNRVIKSENGKITLVITK